MTDADATTLAYKAIPKIWQIIGWIFAAIVGVIVGLWQLYAFVDSQYQTVVKPGLKADMETVFADQMALQRPLLREDMVGVVRDALEDDRRKRTPVVEFIGSGKLQQLGPFQAGKCITVQYQTRRNDGACDGVIIKRFVDAKTGTYDHRFTETTPVVRAPVTETFEPFAAPVCLPPGMEGRYSYSPDYENRTPTDHCASFERPKIPASDYFHVVPPTDFDFD